MSLARRPHETTAFSWRSRLALCFFFCCALLCGGGGTALYDMAWHGRDADIVSLGLTVFAALMGDSGAAAGEPLESYRATNESTGVPELSPLGRYAKPLSRVLGRRMSTAALRASGVLAAGPAASEATACCLPLSRSYHSIPRVWLCLPGRLCATRWPGISNRVTDGRLRSRAAAPFCCSARLLL